MENEPRRCLAADAIRWERYTAPRAVQPYLLDELRAHVKKCGTCLRRHAWGARAAALANMPERTIDEIQGA